MTIQTAFRLKPETLSTLKQLAKDDGRSMTWHVNKALSAYFDGQPQETKKQRKSSSRMKKPPRQEVVSYCLERGGIIDGNKFYDYCEANGWKLSNGNAMKDWMAAIRTWEGRKREQQSRKLSLSERSAISTAKAIENINASENLLGSYDSPLWPQMGVERG